MSGVDFYLRMLQRIQAVHNAVLLARAVAVRLGGPAGGITADRGVRGGVLAGGNGAGGGLGTGLIGMCAGVLGAVERS